MVSPTRSPTPVPNRCRPPVLPPLIQRRRLLERLHANRDRRVILVAAQPAQGKTTLIADYLRASAMPTAWCPLDRETTDTAGFFERLVGALSQIREVPQGLEIPEAKTPKAASRAKVVCYGDLVQEWAGKLSSPGAIVIDGLDVLNVEEGAMTLVEHLFFAIPDGIQLYLICRRIPPLRLQRLRVGRQLLTLNTADLAFDANEVRDFFTIHHRFALSEGQLRRIRSVTEGWAGGLVLLADALYRLSPAQWSALPEDGMAELIVSEASTYFLEEVFLAQTPVLQDFMLRTALLEEIDPPTAALLTGMEEAGSLLSDLASRNLFIQVHYDNPRRDVYRYNPVFREFLRVQGHDSLPWRQRQTLLRRIGRMYTQQARSDLAVPCYFNAGDFKQAGRAIRRAALDLTIGDRLVQLGRWIGTLPAAQRAADPWLCLWQAVAQRSPGGVKPAEGLKAALAGFQAAGDLRGQCFALAYLLETAVFQGTGADNLTQWFVQAQALLTTVGPRPYYTYAKALLWRQIGFGNIFGSGDVVSGLSACRNAQLLARRIGDADLQRSTSILIASALASLGEVGAAEESLVQSGAEGEEKLAPEHRALYRLAQLHLSMLAGNLRRAGRQMETLRQEIDTFGLLFLYPALLEAQGVLQIQQENYAEAGATARHCRDVAVMMASSARIEALALRLQATVYYHLGHLAVAGHLADQALEKLEAVDCGGLDRLSTDLLRGILCWHLGENTQARQALETVCEAFIRLGSPMGTVESHLALALVAEAEQRPEALQAHLAQALGIVNEKGYAHLRVMRPADAALACRLALAVHPGPLADGARRLLAAVAPAHPSPDATLNLQSAGKTPALSFAARRARLPRLEISTLGGFSVLREGRQPLADHEWHGHLPKLLLKAIIVHGIREIPKETLIDDLWPEIEPAAAMQRFKVTLHRLRSALEARIDRQFRWAYVQLKDHLVSLDPELCRIDTAAFQECCTALQAIDAAADDERVLALCRKARSLYRGDFLPEEPYLAWIEAKRNALRDDYVQVLGRMAALLEARGQSEETVAILSAMVQAAPAREDIVRRLMELHQARGQRLLALQTYEKFRDFLSTDLDVVPDPATTLLYRRLMDSSSGDRL